MKNKIGSVEVVLIVVLAVPAVYIIGSLVLMSAAMWFGQP